MLCLRNPCCQLEKKGSGIHAGQQVYKEPEAKRKTSRCIPTRYVFYGSGVRHCWHFNQRLHRRPYTLNSCDRVATAPNQDAKCDLDLRRKRVDGVISIKVTKFIKQKNGWCNFRCTCGLVALTSASQATGRQFDPGQMYCALVCWADVMDTRSQVLVR